MDIKVAILVVHLLVPLLGSGQNDTIIKRNVTNTVIIYEASDCSFTPKKLPRIENENGVFNPNGYNKIYNYLNKVWQEGEFSNGKLYNGKLYIYDSDGMLLKIFTYAEGLQSDEPF